MTEEWLAGPKGIRNSEPGDETLYRDALAIAGNSVERLSVMIGISPGVLRKWLTGVTTPQPINVTLLRVFIERDFR